MYADWKNFRFESAPLEIIDGDRGVNYPERTDFSTNDFCLFLNTGNVTSTGFNFRECSFISQEKDRTLRKGKLKRLDTVLTTRGTVGNVAFYDKKIAYENIRINSGMVILRPDPREIFPYFTYIYLPDLNIFDSKLIRSFLEVLNHNFQFEISNKL